MAELSSIGMSACKYGFETCIHHPLRWLALTVVLMVPILNFVGIGILLKLLRNEEPTFEDGGKAFIQGLLAFFIAVIYLLIPLGVQILLLTGSLGLWGVLLSLLLFIIFLSIAVPGIVNFGRKQMFLSGFMFNEILCNIRRITWGRFVLSLLSIVIVVLLFTLLFFMIENYPVAWWIVLLVLLVPVAIFFFKYWNDVFS